MPVCKVACHVMDLGKLFFRDGVELCLVGKDWGDEAIDDGCGAVEGSVIVVPLGKAVHSTLLYLTKLRLLTKTIRFGLLLLSNYNFKKYTRSMPIRVLH